MTEELERARLQSQSQGPTEGSETGSAADSSSIDQYEIMSKVLGERSDFQRGVGYSKGKGKKISFQLHKSKSVTGPTCSYASIRHCYYIKNDEVNV